MLWSHGDAVLASPLTGPKRDSETPVSCCAARERQVLKGLPEAFPLLGWAWERRDLIGLSRGLQFLSERPNKNQFRPLELEVDEGDRVARGHVVDQRDDVNGDESLGDGWQARKGPTDP